MPRLITSASSTALTDPMVYGWVGIDDTSASHNTVTLIGLSTTAVVLNGRFVVDGSNDTLKPLIAGTYIAWCNLSGSLVGSAGYSVVTYITKNGNNQRSHSGIRSYAGSSSADFPLTMVPVYMNGTSDTFSVKAYQNSGNTCTVNAGSLFVLRVGE